MKQLQLLPHVRNDLKGTPAHPAERNWYGMMLMSFGMSDPETPRFHFKCGAQPRLKTVSESLWQKKGFVFLVKEGVCLSTQL